MKKNLLASVLSALLAFAGTTAGAATAYTFNTSGNWTCPAGVTSIQVECWGGGGAGGAAKATTGSTLAGGGGGGGGAYTRNTTVAVTPFTVYTITVGTGGTSVSGTSQGGTASSFPGDSVTVTANGGSPGVSENNVVGFGAGGAGGTASAGTSFAGGNGALAVTGTGGGGGGSSAANGALGTNATATVTGGTAAPGGGSGGSGSNSSGDGAAGGYPGGGGAGAYAKSTNQRNGGAGGAGQVVITVATPFTFTPGNLAVLVPSDSVANNTALNILEISTNTANQSFAYVVGVDSSDASGLHFSGSAGTSGLLADTADGTQLVFTGVNTNGYSASINSLAARGVGTLNAAASYALQTTYTATVSPTTQPRGASTIDNIHWVIGDQGGMYTNGSVAPFPAGNFNAVKSFGGTNYVMAAKNGGPVVMYFTGTTTNYLPGIPADANATDFYLISSGNNGASFDVLYYIDNTSATAGSIYKYYLSGGTWVSAGTAYSTGIGGWGLCAATNSVTGGIGLYFTTGSASTGNSVVQITDTAAWNAAIPPASPETVLYTAGAGALLKGIAFVPSAIAPTVASSAATSIGTTNATLNGSVTYNGGAVLTNYGFYYSLSSPVTTGGTLVQSGTGDHSGSYSTNLTGLSVNTLYYYRAYASNNVASTLGSSDISFYTLANVPVAPTVGTPTTTTLNVAIGSGDGNPAATTYAIEETTGGLYVQSGGTLGVSPVFQTTSAWGTKTVTGLNPSTTYTFAAEAQNGASVSTTLGATANGTTSTPPSPTITVTPGVLNFSPTLTNTTSANLTYTVSGVNLGVANITNTAPANFQISTSSGSGFGSTVVLTPSGGTVPDTTIYVQFSPTAQTYYSANITHVTSGVGANSPNVTVSGFGAFAPYVSTQAANPTNVTSATLNGTVTATNGALITDRGFYWSASSGVNTTTGTQLDEGGTADGTYSKALTGLNVNTNYYFRAYASNSVGFTLDSADQVACTLAGTPTAPTLGSPTASSINVTISSGDSNPNYTTYAIYVTNSAQYVQPGGALGATPSYQTASAWGTTTVLGLAYGTAYGFKVAAENLAGIATAFGPTAGSITGNGPYTPNNLAILSADVASANNSTFSILEVNPATATLVQTVPINGTTGSSALRTSGSAGSAPKLADSNDGTLLVFAGFNSNNAAITANLITNRAVATLDVSNNFTLQMTYEGVSTTQVRSATTVDNHIWYVADASGIYTNGDTAPLNTLNPYAIRSFGGIVYVLKQSGTHAVSTLSADGTTTTSLSGVAGDGNASDFYLISSGNNGSAYDVLYILDNTSKTVGLITKYSFVGGTWVANGTQSTGIGGYGLAAVPVFGGTGANLYITSGDGTKANNSLYQFPDSAGWNATISVAASNLIYTASGGSTLKGVALAPVPSLVVSNTADSGVGSLRAAIANAYDGGTITFAPNLSGGTITLASPLFLETNLAIDASALPGGITINGNNSVEVFNIAAGVTNVLDALTITNGYTGGDGGGIFNSGTLTLNQCTLSGNNADQYGGGIENIGAVSLNQCTLSGNNANGSGGGAIDEYDSSSGPITVNQSTLSGNSGAAGGIFNQGALTLNNSIVAESSGGADILNENTETFNGANIVQNLADSGSTTGTTPISAAPLIAPLGNYGGPTLTMPPTNGSPAIGACTTTYYYDQRGLPRVSVATADIGAVGFAVNPAGPGALGSPVFTPTGPGTATFSLALTNFTFVSLTVYSSTNLAQPNAWVSLGTATEFPAASGHYQFIDPAAGNNTNCFYRVSSP